MDNGVSHDLKYKGSGVPVVHVVPTSGVRIMRLDENKVVSTGGSDTVALESSRTNLVKKGEETKCGRRIEK